MDVKKIVDTRINNSSQLSGFAKGSDLKFFANEIGHMSYEHNINLAPTKELLSAYRGNPIFINGKPKWIRSICNTPHGEIPNHITKSFKLLEYY